jgi:hypothetical protein
VQLWGDLVKRSMAMAVAAAVAAMMVAPAAHADEQSYLNELSREGFYGPIVAWTAVGYGVCSMTAGGANLGQLTRFVYENTGATVGVAQSERVVELAEIYLC